MAALFKLYLFIWTMLSYNWVDRNLYSVAYNRNAESIDSDELEDYIFSRWHKKVPKPILKKTSGIVIKRDQTAWKNMPKRRHTPWVLLKNDMFRHNGDDDDDSYMLRGSSDSDEDDVSGEEEEEEEESMYDHNGKRNGVNNRYNSDNAENDLLHKKIYKDIDRLTNKCSLPLDTKCLSTVFYHVFKNLMQHTKNKENVMLKSKEQNVPLHQNTPPMKSLHQLLEDIFLKKYGFLPHSIMSEYSTEDHNQNNSTSDEDRNKFLLKLISLIDDGNADTSKNSLTNLNPTNLNKQTKGKETITKDVQSLVISPLEASMEEPQNVTYKSRRSKWKKVKPDSDSRRKHPEIKISFNGNGLNMTKNAYLGLEYFYKLIGILNDLKINFTYSPQKKVIFVNPQSLLVTQMHRNFLNMKNLGWQKRKPFKLQIDFNKNAANNSRIILKTGKTTKNGSDSSEIKIEFLQPVKNVTAKQPTKINVHSGTLFTSLSNTMTITQPPTTTQPTTTQPPPPSPPPPPTTITNHSPMDVNININVNDRSINSSLKAGRKKEINITHIYTHPNNAYGATHTTAPSIAHLGEWTVWYKWSPCSTSCGIGHRKRHRMCLPPGFYCPGNHSEKASCWKRHCNLGTSPPSGHLTTWNTWTECSATCGMGHRSRQRLCLPQGSHCEDNMVEEISCMKIKCNVVTATELLTTTTTNNVVSVKLIVPTGHWTIWQGWSQCSSSCGLGIRKRTRVCLPYGFHCTGDLLEMASCMLQTCDSVKRTAKLTMTITKKTKSKITTIEQTTTAEPPTTTTKVTTAKPTIKIKIKWPTTRPAPTTTIEASRTFTYGKWKPWHDWSECSVSCGYGIQRRERICLTSHCIGYSTETEKCMERHCKSEWTPWNEWTLCSVTCGNGHRSRNRVCLPNRSLCTGVIKEVGPCVKPPCPKVWTPWTEWTVCSVTCGNGHRSRNRVCLQNRSLCIGVSKEVGPCVKPSCPKEWTPWNEWTVCSVTCGNGHRSRNRVCLRNSTMCIGVFREVEPCIKPPCPEEQHVTAVVGSANGEWSLWTEWTDCSVKCGTGHRTRYRACNKSRFVCVGHNTDVETCVLESCFAALTLKTNGHWTSWSDWSHCSKTCNKGHRKRFRSCSPKGAECKGFNVNVNVCIIRPCHKVLPIKTPGSWTSWSEWSHCSASCNIGIRRRFHRCLPKGSECHGNQVEVKDCIDKLCATGMQNKIHGRWTSWSEWSVCSASCGKGIRSKFRSCLPKGAKCYGDVIQVVNCMLELCAAGLPNKIHSSWTSWSEWSHCSTTCNSGRRERFRSCLPKNSKCQGSETEEEECMHRPCHTGLPNKTQSSWTSWSQWSHCSSTCDVGRRRRFRSCLPKGIGCRGNFTEGEECMHKPCLTGLPKRTHNSWTSWSQWSHCSSTCDVGRRRRFRSCLPTGVGCRGNFTEGEECMHKPCLTELLSKSHGSWTSWSEWSSCSSTCDSGHRRRFRSCLIKGSGCHGNVSEEEECMHKPCHSNLPNKTRTSWTSWSEWSSCSSSCDSGHRRRFRSCLPKGSKCQGNVTEEEECMRKPCHPKLPVKIHSSWTSWSQWSSCSSTCDSGHRRRFRSCLIKGSGCHGNVSEEEQCMHKPCHSNLTDKLHSSWTSWSQWSSCSSSCDLGHRRRFRSCLPEGVGCHGNVNEEEECLHKPCQIEYPEGMHGEWDKWSSWTPCSISCGNGQQKRIRICLSSKSHCYGNRKEVKTCMERNCTQGKFVSTGGYWTQWTQWSNCSVACGSGQQRRRRACHPVSRQCKGDNSNVRLCIEKSCFLGQWSKWSDWSHCSAACGRGQITRHRACIPVGSQCSGKNIEHMVCMQRSCDKENVMKVTSVLQGKFTKLKCCTQKNCHRSKYKWLMPDGKLIVQSNSSENRFFAVNEYLIIEKTQKKDKGTYRCLKINGNAAKGIELPLVVRTCENKPCLHKGTCKDTIFSPQRLYKTVCNCAPGYYGSVCQIDKTSPFSSKLAIILAVILIILFCVLLVILLVYFCYRRGKLKRSFDSKMNVLLEFNHDNTFNPSDDKCNKPSHKGLNKTEFYTSEKFYPESIIRTTTIDAITEEKDWRPQENSPLTPS